MEKKKKGFAAIFLTTLLLSLFLCLLSYVMWYLFLNRTTMPQQAAETVPVVREETVTVPSEDGQESEDAHVPDAGVQLPPSSPEQEELPPSSQMQAVDEGPEPVTVPEAEAESEPSSVVIPDATDGTSTVAPEVAAAVPPVPVLFSPAVTQEPLVITGSDTPVYDDAFFASFFVQGQDTLQYDDGLYYFSYSIDGDVMGNLEVMFSGSERLMNVSELQMFLSGLLTDEAYNTLLGPQVGDYVSIEHFRNNGVTVNYSEDDFTIDMSFSVSDMPERVISLAGSSYLSRTFALSGATRLEPDFFSWRTSYNLYTNLDWNLDYRTFNYSLSLSLSNYLNFGPVNFDFFYNFGVRNGNFFINWNNYRFYYDFIDEGIRLSWGNVYGFGLSPAGTPLGIQFEKSYSYGVLESPYNSHREYITITQESYLLIIRNSRVIYQRLLQPGNYRIQDFTFDSGYNEVEVVVIPSLYVEEGMDLSDPLVRAQLDPVSYHQFFDMAYDSQLLARGETLFGGSLSFGRTQVDLGDEDSATGLLLRVSPDYYYDYHLDDFVLSWYQDIGVTDELTLMSDFSLRVTPERKVADMSLAMRTAWILGTTTFTLDSRFDTLDTAEVPGSMPYFYARLDHSFIVDYSLLRGLSFSLSYGNSTYNGFNGDELNLRLSFSGALGILRYSATTTFQVEDYDFSDLQWRVSASAGISPMRNMSISAGITATHGMGLTDGVRVSGYLTASFSFGGRGSASYSTNLTGSHSLSGNVTVGSRDSLSMNLSGFEFSDPANHMLSGSWYHSGDLYGLSVRASAYNRYQRLSLTASLNTATLFSGGLFGFSRSARDNFVLIRPSGSLTGSTVQVARSNQGSAMDVDTVLGTASYTSLSSYRRNNIVVYATPDDEFAETQTFAYELNPDNRQGYSIRISVPQEYTVTGVLSFDGVIQNTFSSPVYRVVSAEDGSVSLVDDISLYLFADQDGRFIISGVEPGDYIFDVSYAGQWYAVLFTVDELSDDTIRVVDFGTIDFNTVTAGEAAFARDIGGTLLEPVPQHLEDYYGLMEIQPARLTDSATFWNELFPPLTAEEIISDFAN